VALGGTLDLSFALGVDVASQSGRTIDVFDWAGVAPTGAFNVHSPYIWDPSHLYSTGEIILMSVPEPAVGLMNMLFGAYSLAWRGRRSRSLSRSA
jgi:hypothetical protein